MKRLILIFASVFCLVSMTTPDGRISMKGSFLRQMQPRDSVLIGDQLAYGMSLENVEEGTLISLPDYTKGFMDSVEVVEGWKADTVKVIKGKKGGKTAYNIDFSTTITSFDEGQYQLPQLFALRQLPDGQQDTLEFDPQLLEVKTFPIDTVTYQPHDIRGQVRYPLTWAEVKPYLIALWILVVLGIAIGCLVIMYRNREVEEEERSKEPAHIVALRKLDKFRGNKYWAPEKQKAFYSGVTDALREYIAARYGFGAKEMTTAEIFDEFKKNTDLNADLYLEMKELFEASDFVKFAKMTQSDEDNAKVLPKAIRFVTETYQAEVDDEAALSATEPEKEK